MVYEDYLPCSAYEGHSAHDSEAGFTAFYDEASQRYFFALLDANGKVLLKSEGYPQAAARENGIQSVLKNRSKNDFYSVKEEDGKYFLSLRAGNHREIARSCSLSSEAEAMALVSFATGETTSGVLSSVGPASAVSATAATTTETASATVAPVELEDDYLSCNEYEGRKVNDRVNNVALFKHDNGQYYFAIYNTNGSVRLRSEGFGSAAERDKELSGVLKNLNNPEMYSTIRRGNHYISVLKDKTGREVGRSCLIKDEPSVATSTTVAATQIIADDASMKTVITTSTGTTTVSDDDSMKAVISKTTGTTTVSDDDSMKAVISKTTGTTTVSDDDSMKAVISKTTGTTTVSDDDSMKAVISKTTGKVETISDDDSMKAVISKTTGTTTVSDDASMKAVISTTTGATQTIITEDAAMKAVVTTVAGAVITSSQAERISAPVPTAPPPPVIPTFTPPPTRVVKVAAEAEDDYLPCREYENHPVTDKDNNIALFKHTDGQYYFVVYNKDGSVRLRGEGFSTTELRDSELKEVIKNLDNKEMYSIIKRGDYSISVLKDKTGREVGRSCLFKEERVFAPTVLAPRVETVVAEIVKAPIIEEPIIEVPVVAAIVAAPIVAAIVETPAPPKVVEVEDDYLPCKDYEGRNVNDKVNNVALFKHDNGQYYFALYNADGSVRLRSEGFGTARDRDSELSGVMKNLNNPEMYTTIRKGDYYISVLKDKTGREVGRSCLLKEEPKIVEPAPIPVAAIAAVAAVAVAAMPSAPKDKDDDYLNCQEYQGHKSNKNGMATFTHSNGQKYFAWHDKNGKVLLRSEGFTSEAKFKEEFDAVIKYRDDKNRWNTIEKADFKMNILKTPEGREIGRSCLEKIVVAPPPVVVPPPAAKVVEVEAIAPVLKKVVAAPIIEAAAPVVEAAGSGFNWKWLLLLPLLLGAWWLYSKGCNTEPPVAATPVVVPVETAKPVVVAPVVCPACATSNDPIFTSVCENPKKLSRLGTNPEFGNSHDLSPEQFYAKIKKAYSDNDVDKEFLDRIYKAMGYTGGFADAKPEQFSAVVLPVGSTGRLGYSKAHKTGCYTLPDDEYHRKAFHIKAANGCDLHFMKTCGNHFFMCQK
jgi:uncharacterized protein YegP (UPF0339 family)